MKSLKWMNNDAINSKNVENNIFCPCQIQCQTGMCITKIIRSLYAWDEGTKCNKDDES